MIYIQHNYQINLTTLPCLVADNENSSHGKKQNEAYTQYSTVPY